MLTSKPIVNSTQVQCNPETVSHLLRVALSCFGHCCHQGCALTLGLLVLLVRLLRRTFLGHFVLVDHLRSFGLLSFGSAVFTVGFFTTIMFIASFCFIFISIPFSIFIIIIIIIIIIILGVAGCFIFCFFFCSFVFFLLRLVVVLTFFVALFFRRNT